MYVKVIRKWGSVPKIGIVFQRFKILGTIEIVLNHRVSL